MPDRHQFSDQCLGEQKTVVNRNNSPAASITAASIWSVNMHRSASYLSAFIFFTKSACGIASSLSQKVNVQSFLFKNSGPGLGIRLVTYTLYFPILIFLTAKCQQNRKNKTFLSRHWRYPVYTSWSANHRRWSGDWSLSDTWLAHTELFWPNLHHLFLATQAEN